MAFNPFTIKDFPIFAGFFIIRYSIDAGLFGPGLRVMTAAIFGLTLIALSEFGSRVPRIGHVFREDARIRQTLAGAGIAILYATLYMASELYGLISLQWAFLLVIAVTSLALFMSLRHGPPTAIMGVIGGFAAPWVAQMGPDSMPALLMYLGVFIAGLFGLSIWQRWLWLLLLATGGGALWTAALVISAQSGLPLLGAFITILGAAAILSATRIAGSSTRMDMIAVFAPLSLAMLQIAVLLPRMEFSPLGWAFMLALGILAIALAWRDGRLRPLIYLAAIITIFPILSGWIAADNLSTMTIITAVYVAVYTIAGQLRIWRDNAQSGWSGLAIFPPLIVAIPFAFHSAVLGDGAWAAIAVLAGLPAAAAAWLYRDERTPKRPVSVAASSVSVLLFAAAAMIILPADLIPAILLIAAASLAAWGQFTAAQPLRHLAALPLTLGITASFLASLDVLNPMLGTLAGSFAIYEYLPTIGDNAVDTLLPALILLAMALHPRVGLLPGISNAALVAGGIGIAMFLWLASRGIFTISTPADFITYGFAERMALTLAIGIAGAAAIWQGNRVSSSLWRNIGVTLLCVVAVRVVQFDLLLFNPVLRAQAVGPAPIANLATILGIAAVMLFWFASKQWQPTPDVTPDESSGGIADIDAADNSLPGKAARAVPRLFYALSLAAAIVTALVTVRQMIHGSIIANAPVTTNENYLYSVALLLLSLAWLARGILSGARPLRIAGLALLTAVTVKVFIIDAAALEGIVRILSFLGLGIALIAIGWAYGRLIQGRDGSEESVAPMDTAAS